MSRKLVVTYRPSSDMKNTQFDYLYATTYHSIRDEILSFYKEILQISGNLWSKEIMRHEVIMPQVHRTVYEDVYVRDSQLQNDSGRG